VCRPGPPGRHVPSERHGDRAVRRRHQPVCLRPQPAWGPGEAAVGAVVLAELREPAGRVVQHAGAARAGGHVADLVAGPFGEALDAEEHGGPARLLGDPGDQRIVGVGDQRHVGQLLEHLLPARRQPVDLAERDVRSSAWTGVTASVRASSSRRRRPHDVRWHSVRLNAQKPSSRAVRKRWFRSHPSNSV